MGNGSLLKMVLPEKGGCIWKQTFFCLITVTTTGKRGTWGMWGQGHETFSRVGEGPGDEELFPPNLNSTHQKHSHNKDLPLVGRVL